MQFIPPAQTAAAQTDTSLSVQPASSQLYKTCADSYRIIVENVTNLYAFDVSINFDPAILQVQDANASVDGIQIRQGSFLENGYLILNQVDNTAGTIRYAATQVNPQTPKSGSGVLLEINFKGVAVGTSPITIINPQLAISDGSLAPVTINDGTLEITSFPVGGACPVTPTPSPTITPTPNGSNTPAPSHRKTKTPTPVFTPVNTRTPQYTSSPVVAPTRTATQTALPSNTPTPTPILLLPAPTRAACKPAPTPAACAPATPDPLKLIVQSLSDGRILLFICPAGLLFLILALLAFLLLRRDAEPEEPPDEIDYQI